jgi:hypothetical protein
LKLPAATATASPPPVLSPTLLHVCSPCVCQPTSERAHCVYGV